MAKQADVDTLQAENDALKADLAAKDAQQNQMLDMLADIQGKIEALEAGGPAAVVQSDTSLEAQMAAEQAALMEEFKDYPAIETVGRRIDHGTDANMDIRLTTEPSITDDPRGLKRHWKLRWFNFVKDGRSQEAAAKGYMKVLWEELQDPESIATGTKADPFVRKGDKGLEVLHKIPLKLFEFTKRTEGLRAQGLLNSESKMRNLLSNRVADMAGSMGDNADQAGSMVASKRFQVTATPFETEHVGVVPVA